MPDSVVELTRPLPGRAQQRSVALDYLRTFIVLLVVVHHSFTGYAALGHFDGSHYLWSSGPIVDPQGWFGFDVFLMFTEVFFMSAMFLLSGLFVARSLQRRGAAAFLRERLLRLGVPFAVALIVVMPPTFYPSFRVGGGEPGLLAYWWHTIAIGPRPNGPIWFIGVLLLFDAAAAAMHAAWPDWSRWSARFVAQAADRPALVFAALLGVSLAAYLPLLLRFGADRWLLIGPVQVQASRVLLYAAYFAAGVAIGRADSGLLSRNGVLARQWRRWLAVAILAYGGWLAWRLAELGGGPGLPRVAGVAVGGTVFAVACCAIGFGWLALFLRFAQRRNAMFDSLTANAYGIYLVHYLPLVWLQYMLLPAGWPAVAKALSVVAGTLALSWPAVAAARRLRIVRAVV